MNDWECMRLTLWMDFAYELREFIECGELTLPYHLQEKYDAIIKKYEEGENA